MKILVTLLLAISTMVGFSQSKISLSVADLLEDKKTSIQSASGEMTSLLVKGDPTQISAVVESLNGRLKWSSDNICAVEVPLNSVRDLAMAQTVKRIDHLDEGRLLNDSVRYYNNVEPLHQGNTPLARAYTGKGVIVGIMDTGLDYAHPDFYNDNGEPRTLWLWDQRRSGGPQPAPYNYGWECDYQSIVDKTCPSRDYGGGSYSHGTHVTGTAAAYDQKNNGLYTGMAPGANIIAVALNFNDFGTAVLDGARYIFEKAEELGMPCVINLSAGSYSGSHDGNDPYSEVLKNLIMEKPGRAFVNAAGNGGGHTLHLGYDVKQDTSFTWFRYIGGNVRSVRFNLYSDSIDFTDVHFAFQADDKSNFNKIGSTPFLNVNTHYTYPDSSLSQRKDTIRNADGDIVGIADTALEIYNKRYGLRVRITNTNSNYLWRLSTFGAGRIDVYSKRNLTGTSDMVFGSALPSSTTFPEIEHYAHPDRTQNIVGYWNCLDQVISAGNYVSKTRFKDVRGNISVLSRPKGAIYHNSSRGPTRDGRLKPEIVSPGAMVVSAGKISYLQSGVNNYRYRFIAPDSLHFRLNGTSMSAPGVTGVIALLFERYPDMTWKEIKETLTNGARSDSFTGTVPNNTYGHGKIDAFEAISNPIIYGCTEQDAFNYDDEATVNDGSCIPIVEGCMDPAAINYKPDANTDNNFCLYAREDEGFYFEILPNVVSSSAILNYYTPEKGSAQLSAIFYNSNGQHVLDLDLPPSEGSYSFDKNKLSLASGIYYIELRSNGKRLAVRTIAIQ